MAQRFNMKNAQMSMPMHPYIILCIIILISAYPLMCEDVASTFGNDSEKLVGLGPLTSYRVQRTVDSIKQEINEKVDRGNDLVRDEGLRLVGRVLEIEV